MSLNSPGLLRYDICHYVHFLKGGGSQFPHNAFIGSWDIAYLPSSPGDPPILTVFVKIDYFWQILNDFPMHFCEKVLVVADFVA